MKEKQERLTKDFKELKAKTDKTLTVALGSTML